MNTRVQSQGGFIGARDSDDCPSRTDNATVRPYASSVAVKMLDQDTSKSLRGLLAREITNAYKRGSPNWPVIDVYFVPKLRNALQCVSRTIRDRGQIGQMFQLREQLASKLRCQSTAHAAPRHGAATVGNAARLSLSTAGLSALPTVSAAARLPATTGLSASRLSGSRCADG